MLKKILSEGKKVHPWMLSYVLQEINSLFRSKPKGPINIFFCICDHFEPLWAGVDYKTGLKRVKNWCDNYPAIAERFRDTYGCIPKHTFFYPIEEYHHEYMDLLANLCHQGFGEVEIHLHHDNDSPDNLRKQLLDFKNLLADKYKLLSRDKDTDEIKYGFIHGNWALDNSRPDGRWCGVNNELQILEETGCYADFTMPSAPDVTQTYTVNSIYYAIDDPNNPKSHNKGKSAEKNLKQPGLLMVQGPLMLNWRNRKWGILPKIDSGLLCYDYPVSLNRVRLWLKANIQVQKADKYIFIKLYTHGCQEKNVEYLLNGGFDAFFTQVKDIAKETGSLLHYVSAREMVNVIRAIEDDVVLEDINYLRDYKLAKI